MAIKRVRDASSHHHPLKYRRHHLFTTTAMNSTDQREQTAADTDLKGNITVFEDKEQGVVLDEKREETTATFFLPGDCLVGHGNNACSFVLFV